MEGDEVALRTLAGEGRLAVSVTRASGEAAAALRRAAYAAVWPIVFDHHTRPIEVRRGHRMCAAGLHTLAQNCLDRFHDDVEAVVDDLLSHARYPIHDLDAWIASRIRTTTVDWYRKQRGRTGALQRPRVPEWLGAALGGDPWLCALAREILIWVGIPSTAGIQLWPLDQWADLRAEARQDWYGSTPTTVMAEVEQVLAAMRRRPAWYESRVETPLGRKPAPLAFTNLCDDGGLGPPPLTLVGRDDRDDARLAALASLAIAAIRSRLRAGENPVAVVTNVVGTVFGLDTGADLDRAPGETSGYDERVFAVLADPGLVARVVDVAVDLVTEERPS